MKTITLNETTVIEKGHTTKYWRDVEVLPQSTELKTWGSDNPLFYLKGICINSHDPMEIGKEFNVLIQTYSFWLNEDPKYTIN